MINEFCGTICGQFPPFIQCSIDPQPVLELSCITIILRTLPQDFVIESVRMMRFGKTSVRIAPISVRSHKQCQPWFGGWCERSEAGQTAKGMD